jgi:hypothetical protein
MLINERRERQKELAQLGKDVKKHGLKDATRYQNDLKYLTNRQFMKKFGFGKKREADIMKDNGKEIEDREMMLSKLETSNDRYLERKARKAGEKGGYSAVNRFSGKNVKVSAINLADTIY